jgi:hypothetical protein
MRPWQVWIKETSASEPLMRCRKLGQHQNRWLAERRDKFRGNLFTAWAVNRLLEIRPNYIEGKERVMIRKRRVGYVSEV